jgi:hypothetical protein
MLGTGKMYDVWRLETLLELIWVCGEKFHPCVPVTPGPVSSVQSNGFAFAELALPPVVVASGEDARGVEDCFKPVGWLGVVAAATPTACIPAIDDISSKAVTRIEEKEVNLLSFALIL